jgi:hypothetical protein
MPDKQFLPVNWVDGMKINRDHFQAQDNAHRFMLAQNTNCLLNTINYGILPTINAGAGVKLFLSSDSQNRLQVRVQQCRAITYGGYYIEFDEDTPIYANNFANPVISSPVALRDMRTKGNEFFIVLSVDPFSRVPYGQANSNEMPPRAPFSLPEYKVEIVSSKDVSRNVIGPFQLPVGKIMIDEQRVILMEDYIPPCASTGSHNDLIEIHAALEQFYIKMEVYSLQILQKIIQKKQINDLSVIVQRMCEVILMLTANYMAEFKTLGLTQPPAFMVQKAAAFARSIKNTMDAYQGSGKEELMNYFTEWCNIKQGVLDAVIVELSSKQYDHLDLNESITSVSAFTKMVSKLFYQLSRIEYIGKRKESGIFVKEEVVSQNEDLQKPKRRSFLAD